MQCKLSISQLILDNWDKPVERFRKKRKRYYWWLRKNYFRQI